MTLTVETFATLDEAARAAADRGTAFLGGGTLIMRAVNYGEEDFTRILRTADPALGRIEARGDRIVIGAGVTMTGIIEHRDLAFLAPAARAVGGPAVRTQATVGGNLYAPHPYGDLATALIALGATVTAAGAGGREAPAEELVAARDRNRPLVAAVTVPRPAPEAFRFLKVTRVHPKGVSLMTLAALLPRSGGRIAGARIAYGAMAATPVRVPAVERALEGRRLDASGVAPALAAATEGLDPPTDALASSWYRREVAPVHLRRLLLGS